VTTINSNVVIETPPSAETEKDRNALIAALPISEVDENEFIALSGVVKISRVILNGTSLLRCDGFALANQWQELSPANLDNSQVT